ncbi:hypothetical protein NPX13_g8218 [Xylaria arbuscula]|uniref:Uncharacterized protein n=1 Tax=Xylaria arbuscula TaxID=114810 RepID=A0A9W8N8U5_9PEZI|nr:hypothetical protein NPX13_g8218 [Xylaria arbuscula]
MAVAPCSQCYQAVRRHLRPHYDSIWVSDSLLASAFERYAATFRTGARYGSSVPGPMEHRKRHAKRHMGELHFGQSNSGAPIWDLANLVDLTQWKWTPPTPPDMRNRRYANAAESPGLSDAVLSSLQALFHSRTDTADDPKSLDAILLPEDVVLSGVAETLPSDSWGANHTPLDVIAAALGSLNGLNDMTILPPLFSEFCDSWQRALTAGRFHGEVIGQVLANISVGLKGEDVEARSSRIVDRLRLLLLDATIEGLSNKQTDNVATFDSIGWSNILHEVSTVQMNTVRVFTKAMACIPRSSLAAMLPSISENLDACFRALGRDTTPSSRTRQTRKMATPLEPLGNPEFRPFLEEVTNMVLGYENIDGISFVDVRFSWLQILARLPGVNQKSLARACNALESGSAARRLTEPEVCQLFFMWANVRAPLDKYTELYYIISRARPDMYSQLGALLWKSRQFHLAKPWSRFLLQIGRDTQVTSIVRKIRHIRRGPPRLAKIALGMRRPLAAVDILCLVEESWKRQFSHQGAMRRDSNFWDSRLGFRALEILTCTSTFDHRKLFRSLYIKPSRHHNWVVATPLHAKGLIINVGLLYQPTNAQLRSSPTLLTDSPLALNETAHKWRSGDQLTITDNRAPGAVEAHMSSPYITTARGGGSGGTLTLSRSGTTQRET